MMYLIILPPALLGVLGLAALLSWRAPRLSDAIGGWGTALACAAGAAVTAMALVSGQTFSLSLPWNTEIGASFSVELDALSGFFLLPIYAIPALAALYGKAYMKGFRGRKNLGAAWLFFDLLAASMVMVILSRNVVLFLVSWEVMSLSSYFLVTFENEQESVRRAGVTYLIATQIGTAFLLVLFLVLGRMGMEVPGAAALDFSRFGGLPASAAGAAFLLALVGFGTKAGIVPLHIWLPEAHPAAPSHVSAVMSGVMIKTGIYGIVRMLAFLGTPPSWWGWTLLAVGAVSGILGVLFALAQHDLKRLLAYHSVENIGIICLGLGIGLLGVSYGVPVVAVLGFAGGLLHVVNHALFKSLLFLGAGAAAHATGTRNLEKLGGLLKRMPVTGAAFLVGAVAICGLPPLNGFVSELLVYVGAFRSVTSSVVPHAAAAAGAVVSLALIGGLAAACFTKAFGIAFLGEARSPAAAAAHEAHPLMRAPLVLLAAACLAVGLLGPLVLTWLAPLVASVSGIPAAAAADALEPMRGILAKVVVAAAVLAALTALLVGLRALLLSRRRVETAGTWDCGYVQPTSRMQYTASSFAAPLLAMFQGLIPSLREGREVAGLFPKTAHFASESPDIFEHRVFRPAFSAVGKVLARFRWIQHGRLQLYVLYIAATLVILLVWKLS